MEDKNSLSGGSNSGPFKKNQVCFKGLKKGISVILEGVKNYGVGLGASGEGFKQEQSFTAPL